MPHAPNALCEHEYYARVLCIVDSTYIHAQEQTKTNGLPARSSWPTIFLGDSDKCAAPTRRRRYSRRIQLLGEAASPPQPISMPLLRRFVQQAKQAKKEEHQERRLLRQVGKPNLATMTPLMVMRMTTMRKLLSLPFSLLPSPPHRPSVRPSVFSQISGSLVAAAVAAAAATAAAMDKGG